MSAESRLAALPGVNSDVADKAKDLVASIISEIPDAPIKLSAREKKIWEHVTIALLEYGLVHRTDGLMLTVICRTFCDWVDATVELDKFKAGNANSIVTESANGYRTPHPLYYIAKDHKKSLLEWLPEAALTIPSFQKFKGAETATPQLDMFDDPVEAHRARKSAIGIRQVK